MDTTTGSATESARLAEASGLTVEQVEANLSAGLVFFRETDYFGGQQPPGEWLDATGAEYVISGLGAGDFTMYWGSGATVEAAKAEFRKHGGRLGKGYTVIEFGPGSAFVGIGPMGYRWVGQPPTTSEVPAR